MTALPSQPSLHPFGPSVKSPEDTRREIDALIHQNRRVTPASVTDNRAVPRASIAELNALDLDQIRDRFLRSRRDDRPPIVRVLDLIDAPRNVIANVLFRGAAHEAAAEGERAAFGLPRVNFSDALKSMGVENRVVRGLVGFVGDVALDPLTYVGGAGVGLKAIGKGGQTVSVGLSGRRALQRGIRTLVRQGAVADDVAGRLLRAVEATPEVVEQARRAGFGEKEIERGIRETVFGSEPATRAGKLAARAGLAPTRKGGLIAERLIPTEARELTERELAQGDAVREFVGQFGTGSRPGLRFGNAGSQVLHLPFTDIGVSVPAFTKEGRIAVRNRVIASSGRGQSLLNPQVLAMHGAAAKATAAAERARQAFEEISTEATEGTQSLLSEGAARVVAQARAEVDEAMETARSVLPLQPEKFTQSPQSVADFLQTVRLAGVVQTKAERLASEAGVLEKMKTEGDLANLIEDPDGLRLASDALDDTIDSVHNATNALFKEAHAMRGSVRAFANSPELAIAETVKAALGTSDDVVGLSLMAPVGRAILSLTPDDSTAAYTVMRLEAALSAGQSEVFGVPSGAVRRFLAWYKLSQNAEARRVGEMFQRELVGEVKAAMQAAGVPENSLDDALVLANMLAEKIQNPDGALTWTTKWGSDELEGYAAALDTAMRDGLFRENLHPGFRAALEEIVGKRLDLFKSIGEQEVTDDILGVLIPGYIPRLASQRASELISSGRKTVQKTRATSRAREGALREFFQNKRSTDQYRFRGIDPETGEEVAGRFFEWQRVYLGLSKSELLEEFGDPEVVKAIEEIQKTIQTHTKLVRAATAAGDEEALARLAPKRTDVRALNELVHNEGAFAPLTGGGNLPRGFFEENLAAVGAARMAAHTRATSRRQAAEIARQWLIPVPDGALKNVQFTNGAEFRLSDGTLGKILVTGERRNRRAYVVIGGQRYRRLAADVGDNPIIDAIMDGISKAAGGDMGPERAILHEAHADAIEQMARLFKDDVSTHAFLKTAEDLTNIWKRITLSHPSWGVVNIVGDLILGLTAGLNPAIVGEEGANWAKIVWHQNNPEKLAGLTVAGRPAVDVLREMQAAGVAGNNLFAETSLQFLKNGNIRFRPMGFASSWHDAMARAAVVKRYSDNPTVQKALATPIFLTDRAARYWSAWFGVNQKIADFTRGLTYLSLKQQGFDDVAAANRVIENMYDYGDLTRVERRLRLLMPFYTWIRGSAAHQLRLLFERPAYVSAVPKLQVALNDAIAGDDAVPEHLRPNWMREQLAIQIGNNPEKRWALLPGSAIPQETMMRIIQGAVGADGVMDFLNYFGSNLNPLLRVPTELAFGRELFSDREIGPDALSGDVSVASTILGQIRQLRELGIGQIRQGPLIRDFERGIGPGASRLLIGGRAQPFGAEHIRFGLVRQFKSEEEDLRRGIAVAEREGRKDLSVRGRVRLLQLYKRMIDSGLADKVPAWAREQLATLDQSPPAVA